MMVILQLFQQKRLSGRRAVEREYAWENDNCLSGLAAPGEAVAVAKVPAVAACADAGLALSTPLSTPVRASGAVPRAAATAPPGVPPPHAPPPHTALLALPPAEPPLPAPA